MGFLDKILGSTKEKKEELWFRISTTQEADGVIKASKEKIQVILKHSGTCGVSFFAKKGLDSIPPEGLSNADMYIVDVIRDRNLAYYLADRFSIRHESPQILVIKNEKVIWHGSHGLVTADNLISALE
ncbi:MAG: bacillithiol system redox-active protein YtxJ [Balneolaceae bacterium]